MFLFLHETQDYYFVLIAMPSAIVDVWACEVLALRCARHRPCLERAALEAGARPWHAGAGATMSSGGREARGLLRLSPPSRPLAWLQLC